MFKFLPVNFSPLKSSSVKLVAAVEAAKKDALKAAGEVIKKQWQENIETTLTHGYATGAYHDSIEVTDIVTVETDIGELPGVEVGTTIRPREGDEFAYPYFLEFGTVKMPAYPTATPAFEEKKDEAIAVARKKVAEAVVLAFPAQGIGALQSGIAALESSRTGVTAAQLGRG